ncbi:MAG: HPP family protein [Luteolibacter sp.]
MPIMNQMMRWLGVELSAVSGREKMISAIGGFVALVALTVICERWLKLEHAEALVCSMGASAVLLFGVPHGPLAQPWPVIAGHGLSAFIGVCCAKFFGVSMVSAALAVGTSIGVMHQLKCIHPPGGASALIAVMGGASIQKMGFHFVWCPVLLNAVVMVGVAVAFNFAFGWRRYPVVWADKAKVEPVDEATHLRIVAALRDMDSFVDISEEDLVRLAHGILAERPGLPAMIRNLNEDDRNDAFADDEGLAHTVRP